MTEDSSFPVFDATRSLALLARATASAQAEEANANLPRLLRYALEAQDGRRHLRSQLFSEIAALAPDLSQVAESWAKDSERHSRMLADTLDAYAVDRDRPLLYTVANTVRLLGVSDNFEFAPEHRCVAASLRATFRRIEMTMDDEQSERAEAVALGWSILAAGVEEPMNIMAFSAARHYAEAHTRYKVRATVREVEQRYEVTENNHVVPSDANAFGASTAACNEVPDGFVRVCPLDENEFKAKKLKDIVSGHEHVLGCAVKLAPVPDIAAIRKALVFEFPYAMAIIDRLLDDLVGQQYIHLKPTILVGPPGSGKSFLSRRFADLLGAGAWRCDASTADGAVIGGTARRWNSAEPAHPFLAISRTRFANPLMLIDELEKASSRQDYGRLWDSLLGLLEPETAARYPDPALQMEIDISHVSYLATANSLDNLPAPLRDRMRVLEFPEPTSAHLTSLLCSVVAQLAHDRGLDARWIEPLSQAEIDLVSSYWSGGSVRRLKRYVESVLRDRDERLARH